jgi:hypothetical protein
MQGENAIILPLKAKHYLAFIHMGKTPSLILFVCARYGINSATS